MSTDYNPTQHEIDSALEGFERQLRRDVDNELVNAIAAFRMPFNLPKDDEQFSAAIEKQYIDEIARLRLTNERLRMDRRKHRGAIAKLRANYDDACRKLAYSEDRERRMKRTNGRMVVIMAAAMALVCCAALALAVGR